MFFFFFNDEKVTAITLANYILKRAEGKEPVTNLKLQKILYYVQGYFLATFDRPLFPDKIQAWKFGPVVPSVYYEFSSYGPDPLRKTEDTTDAVKSACTHQEIELINRVIDQKLKLKAGTLVNDTHKEAPWMNATSSGRVICPNTEISTDSMKEYFRTQGDKLNA